MRGSTQRTTGMEVGWEDDGSGLAYIVVIIRDGLRMEHTGGQRKGVIWG
jgi:hypothetical protein